MRELFEKKHVQSENDASGSRLCLSFMFNNILNM